MLRRKRRSFPGPTHYPLIGNPFAVTRDSLSGLARLTRVHGDLTEFWVGRRHVVVANHPELVEEILVRQRDRIQKDTITHELSAILGQGLVTSEGAHWKRQRRAIAPSFQPRHLAHYGEDMVRSALECLPPTGSSDVHRSMSAATLHIVIRTIFGAEPDGEAGRVGELVEDLMEAFFTEQRTAWRLVPKAIPAAHRKRVEAVRAALDAVLYDLIARARRSTDDRSLLGRLLAARDDDEAGMTDEELRDELITLFLAGHETTSLWLAFTIWLLAEHPELQDRAIAEVDEVLAGQPATSADLRRLPFLGAVLEESLRLYPPVWAIAREVTEPFALRGETLAVGTQIVISMWTLHRDPRFWTGPERFRPDRWLTDETDDLPRMAFMPFGGGPRVCVGNHFAKMEAVLVLATLLQQRRFRPHAGYSPDFIAAVTLRPRNGVQVVSEERPLSADRG